MRIRTKDGARTSSSGQGCGPTLSIDEFWSAWTGVDKAPNPEQRSVIEAGAGVDLHVVAGPGTGKTSSVVLRILKCILVDGLIPSGVVATTFTVKAAAELRSRVLTRGFALLEELSKNRALPATVKDRLSRLDINQIITNTVDGLCQSILRDHRDAGTSPPVIADEFVASTLLLRAGLLDGSRYRDDDLDKYLLKLFGGNKFGWNVGRKNTVLQQIWDRRFHDQINWAAFLSDSEVPVALGVALQGYEKELSDRRMVDFPLLEQTVLERLKVGGLSSFSSNIQALFVDEYQDTNLLQESLYFALAKASGASLTIVGDDDQSLYRFRGATVELFRNFPDRVRAWLGRAKPQTIFLRRNYRSTPTIIDFVNAYAQLDPAYQLTRVSGKPVLLAQAGASAGLPVLGMFRTDVETLAEDLAKAIEAIFNGTGLLLPSGDCIQANVTGNVGDAALLCSSPQETTSDGKKKRLPGLLREELQVLARPIAIFNPRGEEFHNIPVVAQFAGLLLEVVDPDGTIETEIIRSIASAVPVFADWRTAATARLSSGPADLRKYHGSLVGRTPRRGRWPRSTPMLKIIYGLLHYFPDLFDDAEGQVYLEVFTRQLAACAAIGSYDGTLLAAPATDAQIKSAAKELLRLFLAPIATSTAGVNEELIEAFPRNRLPVLSIHQAKGLEFPLAIVDVGADFRTNHRAHAFKRFPSDGGLPHALEDHMRRYSPLKPPSRDGVDRAFDDLYRQYFVAVSRPETVLLLVGLDGAAPAGGIPNVATGSRRDGLNPWSGKRPYLEI